MENVAGIQAQLFWALIYSGDEGLLRESSVTDYSGILDGMEAAQLLSLIAEASRRLELMGARDMAAEAPTPAELYIDRQYRIHLGSRQGREIPFRPLVRALFILFLQHPEGIVLKDRERFRKELEDIYSVIAPNISDEDRRRRVSRLTDLQDNAFSENLSVLNATLDKVLPPRQAGDCKVQGHNGYPRRIPLSPLLVHWE